MKFAKLYEDAKLPTRKNYTDSGIDLYAYYNIDVGVNGIYVMRTGITCEIPKNYFGWITNKSRNNFIIGGGIIDETYQGELLIKIINTSNGVLHLDKGQAIAQLLIIPCITPEVEEVPLDEIHKKKTERGATGGIVTGLVKQLAIEEAKSSTRLDWGKYGTHSAEEFLSDQGGG